jgi:FtsH-binding integral membrane protein
MPSKANFGSRLRARSGFIASVYALLAVQLAVTAVVVALLRKNPETYAKIKRFFWLWFLLSIAVIVVLGFVPMPFLLKAVLFIVFAILLGFNFIAADRKVSPETIRAALISTIGIFLTMTVVAVALAALGVDLSFLYFALFIALIGILVTYIVLIFFPVSEKTSQGILYISMVVFSIYIAYDTNLMLQPNAVRDVLGSAIGLYLDIMNLFSSVVASD